MKAKDCIENIIILERDSNVLYINMAAREWCKRPYKNSPDDKSHDNGCPMYGKKENCPPNASLLHDYFDLSKPICFVVVQFNLEKWMNHMKSKHPKWTDRQAKCVLYWQQSVRKILKEKTQKVMTEKGYNQSTDSPEAMGLNVISTLRKIGLPITKKCFPRLFKVTMLGHKHEETATSEFAQTKLQI